jgi:hypothetical protein
MARAKLGLISDVYSLTTNSSYCGSLNGDGKKINHRSKQRDNQLKIIHHLKKRCVVACHECQNIHEKGWAFGFEWNWKLNFSTKNVFPIDGIWN